MMRLIFLLPFICLYVNVNAQVFAIINDADGFVNVRVEPDSKSKVRGKLSKNDIFSYDTESKEDWIKVYRQDNTNTGLEGYILKNKLLPLSRFKRVVKISIKNNSCIVTNDSIRFEAYSTKFAPKKHRLKYTTCHNCGSILNKIDGKVFFGTDGGLPKNQIQLIKLSQNGKAIQIPHTAYKDLYEPNFETIKIYLGNHNTIYIEMNNSDGAGGYSVIWVIKDGKYANRYLDDSFA